MKAIPLWRQIQRNNFTSLSKLASFLELSSSQKSRLLEHPNFSLNLPQRLAQKIDKQTLDDPILRQFVPLIDETASNGDFTLDPVGDRLVMCTPKLLHKYQGRMLLVTSSACAMHCRFCFRKNFPYETTTADFSQEIAHIAADPSIREIILSGGDPLSLSNESLESLFTSLGTIEHVHRLRIHTRFPIGIPERIDEAFLSLLENHPQKIFIVLHVNHPREIDVDLIKALRPIQRLGIPLLSQTVLLKGINDDEATLCSLYESLVDGGIVPYYLHLLDHVAGSAHFEVSAERGLQLIRYLQEHLSGYAVPRLVREIAGRPSKTHI